LQNPFASNLLFKNKWSKALNVEPSNTPTLTQTHHPVRSASPLIIMSVKGEALLKDLEGFIVVLKDAAQHPKHDLPKMYEALHKRVVALRAEIKLNPDHEIEEKFVEVRDLMKDLGIEIDPDVRVNVDGDVDVNVDSNVDVDVSVSRS